jgi:serine/threonine protein kinase
MQASEQLPRKIAL